MNWALWSTDWAIFSKLSINRASVYTFHYHKRKMKQSLQNQEITSLLMAINISLSLQMDKLVYRSDLETTLLACFSSKRLNYKVTNLYSQKLSMLTIANITTSMRTDFTLQTNVKNLRTTTICSTFTPDSRYDNKTIGSVDCPNTMW